MERVHHPAQESAMPAVNSAADAGTETGRREWICYVPADLIQVLK